MVLFFNVSFWIYHNILHISHHYTSIYSRNCKKFGRQSWLIIAIIITEFLVVIKFGWETLTKPIPTHIAYFWILGFIGLVVYTVWKFWIYRDVKNDIVMHTEESEKEHVGDSVENQINTRSRVNNNNNSKGDVLHQRGRVNNNNANGNGNLHQRARTKNGPSVL